jgi:hypothetical protein
MLISVILLFLFFITPVYSQTTRNKTQKNKNGAITHELMRRLVVFPIQADVAASKEAESTWWEIREKLTESRRFLVASKNFMQAKDVFQSRGELKPADAIILGRLLDSNALITIFLKENKVSMRVYESVNGLTLWSGDIELHVAVPASQQLKEVSKKLLFDFISSVPYQGFVVTDNLIGRPVFTEGESSLFKADIGIGSQIRVGDTIELIQIQTDSIKPLFQDGLQIQTYAEGIVIRSDRNIITVEITRKVDGFDIISESLVRVPKEFSRVKELYGIQSDEMKNVNVSLFQEEKPATENELAKKPLYTSIAWLANLTLMLLLAF